MGPSELNGIVPQQRDLFLDRIASQGLARRKKRSVEIDAGVAIVPQGTVIQEIAKQTLVQVTFEDGEFYRPLAALYKKNKVLSPAMKQFLAVLKDEK